MGQPDPWRARSASGGPRGCRRRVSRPQPGTMRVCPRRAATRPRARRTTSSVAGCAGTLRTHPADVSTTSRGAPHPAGRRRGTCRRAPMPTDRAGRPLHRRVVAQGPRTGSSTPRRSHLRVRPSTDRGRARPRARWVRADRLPTPRLHPWGPPRRCPRRGPGRPSRRTRTVAAARPPGPATASHPTRSETVGPPADRRPRHGLVPRRPVRVSTERRPTSRRRYRGRSPRLTRPAVDRRARRRRRRRHLPLLTTRAPPRGRMTSRRRPDRHVGPR